MAITAVNGNGNSAQVARSARVEPPAPPKNEEVPKASAGREQNNRVQVGTDNNAAVVIERLSPVDVVERQKVPNIEPIPQQVNIPDPLENVGEGNATAEVTNPTPVALPAPPEAPENSVQPQITAGEGEPTAQVQAPEPPKAQGEGTTAPQAEVVAPAVEVAPQPRAEAPAVQAPEPNEAAQEIQKKQAEGQANNNPIAEQEIGGTVNIAI